MSEEQPRNLQRMIIAQRVEHRPIKPDVVGSSPIYPDIMKSKSAAHLESENGAYPSAIWWLT